MMSQAKMLIFTQYVRSVELMDIPTQNILNIKIKRLHGKSIIPEYAKPGDAGLDLTAVSKSIDIESGRITYSTGLAFEIPEGYVGLLFPRSSIYKYDLRLANAVGVIDSDYRGEIKIIYRLTSNLIDSSIYNVGDRVCQMVIMPYPAVIITETSELSDTERGIHGFGSSGT